MLILCREPCRVKAGPLLGAGRMNLEATLTGHTGQLALGPLPGAAGAGFPEVQNRTPAYSFHPSFPIPASPLSLVPVTTGARAARPLPHAGCTPVRAGRPRAQSQEPATAAMPARPLGSRAIAGRAPGNAACWQEKL